MDDYVSCLVGCSIISFRGMAQHFGQILVVAHQLFVMFAFSTTLLKIATVWWRQTSLFADLNQNTPLKEIIGDTGSSGGRGGCQPIRRLVVRSRLLLSTCQSVLGQDPEPQTAHDGRAIGVYEFLMSRLALCRKANLVCVNVCVYVCACVSGWILLCCLYNRSQKYWNHFFCRPNTFYMVYHYKLGLVYAFLNTACFFFCV